MLELLIYMWAVGILSISASPLIVLHVGPWKTGTRYVQQVLSNVTEFPGRVHYPHPKKFAQHYFAEYIRIENGSLKKRGGKAEKEVLEQGKELIGYILGDHVKSNDTVILSSAAFSMLSVQEMDYMKKLFPKFKFQVVLFYRDTCNWMTYMYEESLQSSLLPYSFAASLMRQKYHGFAEVDGYQYIFKRYVEVFSPQHDVRIVDYNGALAHNVDLVEAMFVASKLPWAGVTTAAHINPEELIPEFPRNEILIRQLWRLFDYYTVSKHGCTTLNKWNKGVFKSLSLLSTRLGGYLADVPRVRFDNTALKAVSSQVDMWVRASFADILVYGDVVATNKAISMCPEMFEVVMDDVMFSYEWISKFEEQYQALSESSLTCSK